MHKSEDFDTTRYSHVNTATHHSKKTATQLKHEITCGHVEWNMEPASKNTSAKLVYIAAIEWKSAAT